MAERRLVVHAAGLVVRRHGETGPEFLAVHRPRYDDWTLPKGHVDAGELRVEAAFREFREETGLTAMAGRPLGALDYPVDDTIKRVHWWAGRLTAAPQVDVHDPAEIDVVEWLPPSYLTYENERALATEMAGLEPTRTLLVVRHGKALGRAGWKKDDWLRPLAARGERQAGNLVRLLAAYGVGDLASSTSVRCLQTLQPFADATGLEIEGIEPLSEEGAAQFPHHVAAAMHYLQARLDETGVPVAVCGHRPVLPAMVEALGVDATHAALKPAEVLVVHLTVDGKVAATEHHGSKL